MKTILSVIMVPVAWLLIAGFAWHYADNAYILERLTSLRDKEHQRFDAAVALRDALEQETVALRSDPFYTEMLLRNRLSWVCKDETPQPARALAPPPKLQDEGVPRSPGGKSRPTIFISPRSPGVDPARLLAANPDSALPF